MQLLQRIATLFAEHWRGHHDLLLSVLVTLLGLRIALGLLQPVVPALVIWPWLLASAALLVWQLVGTWRAGDAHLRSGGAMVLLWSSYGAMVIVLALAVLQWLDALVSRAPPAVAASAPALILPVDGADITLRGPLSWPMHTALERALAADPTIQRVVLDSTGGLVFGARALAILVQRNKLDTHVEHSCLSACTLVFMAGAARSMRADAQLGFHQYAIDEPNKVQTINISRELGRDRAYLLSRGVSEEFADQAFRAGPDEMWLPTPAELLRAGVLSAPATR